MFYFFSYRKPFFFRRSLSSERVWTKITLVGAAVGFDMEAPWVFLSPQGKAYHVRDIEERNALADQERVRRDDLKDLVVQKGEKDLPVCRANWQLFQSVIWLQRLDDPSINP